MDGDIGQMIQSVLSDPQQMEKLTAMAQSLMGGETRPAAAPEPEPSTVSVSAAAPFSEAKLLSAISGMMGQKGEQSRSAALLSAMRPYMRPEKQEKLDRAMQIARMVRIAGTVMREWGGDRHGV